MTEEEREFHREQQQKVLKYLSELDDSKTTERTVSMMSFHLSFQIEKYLVVLLEALIKDKLVEKRDAIDISILSQELQESLGTNDFGKYYITNKGRRQLRRGKFAKKKVKVKLTEEEKKKRRDERRATIQHRWIILTIIGTSIVIIHQALYYIFDINIIQIIRNLLDEYFIQ